MNNNNSKIHKSLNSFIKTRQKLYSQKTIEKYIQRRFNKKYKLNNLKYGSIIINNIVYNEKSHIVALFKDYLIIDDLSEFLKRFYTKEESEFRLPKFYEYYETYNKIYPNYTGLPEGNFIYKNIHKKQKMIDLQQAIEESKEKKKNNYNNNYNNNNVNTKNANNNNNNVFSTDVYNSIVNVSEDLYNLLFGIEKTNYVPEQTIIECNKIINEIQKCEKKINNKIKNNNNNDKKINKELINFNSNSSNSSTGINGSSITFNSKNNNGMKKNNLIKKHIKNIKKDRNFYNNLIIIIFLKSIKV
jgi:hypothetical protein